MRVGVILAVVAVAAGACRCGEKTVSGGNLRFVPVRSVEFSRDISATGRIVPDVGSEVKVAPRLSGTLRQLHVSVGDLVKRGQLIAEIDEGTLASDLRRANAELVQAQADAEYARAVEQRKRKLHDRGLVSSDELEVAERDLRRAEAASSSARAAVDAARVQLGYTKLYSPIDGVVASISTQQGETVAASFAAPTFVTIVDASRLKAVAYLDEFDVALVKPGQRVTLTVDALPGETFGGLVRSVNPQAVVRDNVTSYVANIDFTSDTAGKLRPDMTANVSIATGQRTRAIVIAERSVVRDANGQTYVFVQKGGEVEKRRVRLGDAASGGIVVREGLAGGESIEAEPNPIPQ